ncbi:SRPBCC family protein [Sutcliffiella halmapala]|uniref:SRPBCC family protein n=1 Tax=Sutcliffiella halmapala TaxID=79882 RepID=UPI00099542E5|nr:SRPBCC family protein [Sutcliffiella halmapala]
MNKYGTIHEIEGRYALKFVRLFSQKSESVFKSMTSPAQFVQWYPFATEEMDLKTGGVLRFDDGEGSKYEGIITEYNPSKIFAFREINDLLHMELQTEAEGCRLIFTHTFDDLSMTVNMAAGWHRCLDVLDMLVNGRQVEWPDNSAELRKVYKDAFESFVK